MDSPVGWARVTDRPSEHLDKMLSLAVTNFGKQTDWFLLHRDTGIKHLGVVLAAQVSITSITLSTQAVPAWLAIAALLFLGIIGPFLAILAIRSARSSYSASIEYAVLITKSLWALGLTGVIDVLESHIDIMKKPPAANDEVFYIERHVNNHASAPERTTKQIVDNVLKSRPNTFSRARRVLVTFAVAVVTMAIVGSIAVLAKKSGAR
jgi:hypothetical protein